LPADFPDALPSIFVNRSVLPKRVPHIEKTGKVCIAPGTGILLDTTRPRAIVAESLAKAAQTIDAGLSGKNEEDLLDEFLAYWDHELEVGLCSICDADGETRPLHRVEIEGWRAARGSKILVSDTANATEEWCMRLGRPSVPLQGGFLLRLQAGFPPPDFDTSLTICEVCELIRRAASDETRGALKRWLDRVRLPATVLMSMPLPRDSARVLIAVELPAPVGRAAQAAERGFRPGRAPTRRQLSASRHTPVRRMFVERLDPGFLLPRAGTVAKFAARTVAVVGCGAVGSHLVERLASLGIGRLRLVDHEKLIPANIHRHALGMEALGCNKAAALCVMLGRRFPHMKVDYRETRVQDLLESDEDFLITADVLVIALGDETLELRLNRLLRGTVPRVHTWVEPLGVAQHALSTDTTPGSRGCLECVFELDEDSGLVNRAAFAAPRQAFKRSIAGCAGTFTPFTSIDADQAAIEAVTLVSDILLGAQTTNVLVSRFGNPTAFMGAGFKLSPRADMFRSGEVRHETGYARSDCNVCGPTC
jgi:hypothetical protein